MFNLLSITKWGSLVDLIVVAFILLFALIGLYQGFVQRLLGIISKLLSVILAFSLCKPFASLLNTLFSLDKTFARGLAKSFANNDKLNVEILSGEQLSDTMGQEGLPKFLQNAIKKVWNPSGGSATIAQMLGEVVAKYLVIAISFIILIFVVKLACILLRKVINNIEEKSVPILFTNKIFGVALGVLQSLIYVYLALFILNILPNSFMTGVQNAVNNSAVCKFITKYNLFNLVFSSMLNLN